MKKLLAISLLSLGLGIPAWSHPGYTSSVRKKINAIQGKDAKDDCGCDHSQAAHAEPERVLRNIISARKFSQKDLTNLPDQFEFTIERNGVEETMELTKRSIRSEHFKMLLDYGNGNVKEVDAGPVRTYTGYLKSDKGSQISAHLTANGEVDAMINCSDGKCWKIMPPEKKGGGYRTADFEIDPHLTGEERLTIDQRRFLNDAPKNLDSATKVFARPNNSTVRQAELGFEFGFDAVNRFPGATIEEKAANTMIDIEVNFLANTLNLIYISDVLVEHTLGRVNLIMTSAADPYINNSDGSSVLAAFRARWNGASSPSSTHDIAHLCVGHGIGVAGLAYVGTVGESFRYSLSNNSNSGINWKGIARHEVSHSWAMGHGNGCDLEFSLSGGSFSLGMCTGSGTRSNSNESGIGRAHRNGRPNGVLTDIGPFPANLPQEPYCPLDTASTVYGGSPIRIDVLRNDFDANNDMIQIRELRVNNVVVTDGLPLTPLGGEVEISRGTGPGGRDQVIYTPPAAASGLSNLDTFHYVVEDNSPTTRTNFGYVRVTLNPNISPRPLSPSSFLADSSEQWSGEQNPNGLWSYGTYDTGSTNFTLATATTEGDPIIIGGDGSSWIGADAASVSQFTLQTGDTNRAVRRWKSNFTGRVAVEYSISKLAITQPVPTPEIPSPQIGETAQILLNGSPIYQQAVNAGNVFAGRVYLNISQNDHLDLTSDSGGNREGDGLHFHVRVVPDYQTQVDSSLLFHFPLDEAITDPDIRQGRAVDISGNNRHATANTTAIGELWQPGQLGNAFTPSGADQALVLNQTGIGNGATEMTLSIWFKADAIDANDGLLTSDSDFFGLVFRGATAGLPLEFRARNNSLEVPTTIPSSTLGKWTHAVGVWKSGQFQKIYVNGEEVASTTTTASGSASISNWYIGRDRTTAARSFDGQLDDTAVWSRALTAGEIRAMHARGRTARSFNNVATDTINIPVTPANAATKEVTISAWVRPTVLDNNDGILTTSASDSYFGLLARGVLGLPAEFRGNNNSITGAPGSLPVNELTHIAGTWKAGGLQKLYINGVSVASASVPASAAPTYNSWVIGQDRAQGGRFFAGSIGEVLITQSAYNDNQVRNLFFERPTFWDASHGFFSGVHQIGTFTGPPLLDEASGILTITSAGTGTAGTSDAFTFVARPHSGDIDLSARPLATTATAAGQSGIMLRDTLDANAAFAHLYRRSDNSLVFESRASTGAAVTQLATNPTVGTNNIFLRLVRNGNIINAEYSTNGSVFTSFNSTALTLAPNIQAGLTFASGTASAATAQFDRLVLNPTSLDLDMDNLTDAWEITYFCNLTTTAGNPGQDADQDGLTDRQEFEVGTDPTKSDTDADGATDFQEVTLAFSDPFDKDSDNDGLSDGDEINIHRSNPIRADSDSDGLNDLVEVNLNTSPIDSLQIPRIASRNAMRAYWKFDNINNSDAIPDGHAPNFFPFTNDNDNYTGFWRNVTDGSNEANLTWTTGLIGQAADMDGAENHEFRVRRDPLVNSTAITISCWFLPQDISTYEGIISMRTSAQGSPWGMYNAVNKIDFRFAGEGLTTKDLIFAGQGWYHAAMTWANNGNGTSTRRGYVNGNLVVERTNSSILNYNAIATQFWLFGADDAGSANRFREINAQLDEYAMFNVAMTPAQIAAIHSAGRNGVPVSRLVGNSGPPRALISQAGSDFQLGFQSQANTTYSVLTSTTLGQPYSTWTPLTTTLTGTGGLMNFIHTPSPSDPRRFYIIRANPLE